MGAMSFIDEIIDAKFLDLSTSYIAKVLSVSGAKATVRPLSKMKEYGSTAKAQADVPNVPILQNARNKITKKTVAIEGKNYDLAVVTPLAKGDIVLCVVCDRDISQAIKGKSNVPAIGHHSKSDSVIVGVI